MPVNRAGSKRFLKEARAKVYDNARLPSAARQQCPETLAAQLEELCRVRVADLRAPARCSSSWPSAASGWSGPSSPPAGLCRAG